MKNRHIGLLLLLVSLLGWFGVIRPQIHTFSANSLTAKVRSEEALSYNQRVEDLKTIKQQGDAVKSTLDALYLAMPKLAQVPETLVMMESIGANTGVVFSSLSVGTPANGEVPVSLAFTGSLSSVTSFLDGLNKNVRTAMVKGQSMTSDAAGNLSVSMQLGLVYQGE